MGEPGRDAALRITPGMEGLAVKWFITIICSTIIASSAALASPQQNIEKKPTSGVSTQQQVEETIAAVKAHVTSAIDANWREAADDVMAAIEATKRLTDSDRAELAKREKDQPPKEVFRLRLTVLRRLASR